MVGLLYIPKGPARRGAEVSFSQGSYQSTDSEVWSLIARSNVKKNNNIQNGKRKRIERIQSKQISKKKNKKFNFIFSPGA